MLATLLLATGLAVTGCPATSMVLVGTTGPASLAGTGATNAPSLQTMTQTTATPTANFGSMPTPGPVPSGYTGAAAGVVRFAGKDSPPWRAPVDTIQRIRLANLQEAATEAFTYHVHAHVTVYVNGQFVEVPGLIGIDPGGAFISPLHTHTNDGIVHIESPRKQDFHLTQFLTEWGVSPDGFVAYINGQKQPDVASVLLVDKIEITLVAGAVPTGIPSAYPATGP
jgi:hypothetical protein